MQLRDYVRVLRARRGLVFAAIFLFVAIAALAGALRLPEQKAEARVLVSQSSAADALLGLTNAAAAEPDRELFTHAEMVRSQAIATAVINSLDLAETPDALLERVQVEPVGPSDLLAIKVSDTNGARAAAIANAFANEYVDRRRVEQRKALKVAESGLIGQRKSALEQLAAIDAAGKAGKDVDPAQRQAVQANVTSLTGQIDRLRAGAALVSGDVRMAQAATRPRVASESERATGSGMIGLALGLMFGVGLAFTAEHFDTRVRTSKDATQVGLRVIGGLPAERKTDGAAALRMIRDPGSPGADAYRMLRRTLRGGTNGQQGSLLVSSVDAVEIPGVVSANLALAMVQAGYRVALIDADVRGAPLQSLFDLSGTGGLTEVLTGMRSLAEVAQHPVHPRLMLIPSGPPAQNSSELLSSARMQQLMSDAAAISDRVIVCAPPVLLSSDATSALEWVDRLLLALVSKETRQENVAHALELLARLDPAPRVDAVIWGVEESKHGLQPYLDASSQTEPRQAPDAQGAESLRPSEVLVR